MEFTFSKKRFLADLAEGRFTAAYQTRYRLPDRCVVGAEASLEWNPDVLHLNRISPELFLPVAAKFGVAAELVRFLLDEISANRMRQELPGRPVLPVAFELPGPLFLERKRLDSLLSAITVATGGGPIEVMVDHALAMAKSVKTFCQRLDVLGGAGVDLTLIVSRPQANWFLDSRLELPIGAIRIEGEILRQAGQSMGEAAILGNLIEAARERNWRVIAGGVDYERDAAHAILAGCDQGQGLVLSKKKKGGSVFSRAGFFPSTQPKSGFPWPGFSPLFA